MKKEWQFYNTDKEKVSEVSKKYNINKLLATILVNRNIVEEEKVNVFLNPTRNNFHNPIDMPDMEIARDRILKAIETQEKTIIYGDYDVDGITSTTVLKNFLEERGLKVDSYIPNRLNEGYGLNNQEPMTQQEVAEELGISRSYVSRIEKKALGMLKEEIQD